MILARSGPRYVPGAAAAPGGIKLSANELPFDPLPSVRRAIEGVALNRYPDHLATALRRRVAEEHGLDRDRVAVGAGSVGLLQQLALALVGRGDGVAFGWRSFEAYPVFTALVGGEERTAPLRHEAIDLDALPLDERTRLVLVADPNNPTGTTVPADAVDRLLDRVPAGCTVVLDRAYGELVDAVDAADERHVLERGGVVLRTFSKAHGLAALRVGYLLGPPAVVAAVDAVLLPFAVSAVAQAAALAALDAADELAERVAAVRATRARMARALRLAGWRVADAQGSFVWLPGTALDLPGIATRPFPEGTRVTVGSDDEVDRFLAALGAGPDRCARRAQAWLDRLDAVERSLVDLAGRRLDGLSDPDPGGDERWDAGEVWAHVGELGGFWLDELDRVLAGAPTFGRTKADPRRTAAVARGRAVAPASHLASARAAMARCRRVVAALDRAGWASGGVHPTLGPMDVEAILERFVVGHWEEHAAALAALAGERVGAR